VIHQLAARQRIERRDWVIVVAVVVAAVALELVGTGPIDAARTVLATQIDHLDRYRRVGESTLGPVYFLSLVGLGLTFRHWKHGLLLSLALVPPVWILTFHTPLFAMRYLYFAVPILAVAVGLVVEFAVEQTGHLRRWVESASGSVGRWRPAPRARRPVGALSTAIPVGLAVLLLLPSLTVVPAAGYELGPNAPQPDFASAYAYVDANDRPDDVLVAGWTAPALYYHGRVDYWLAHDLTSADRTWTTDDGVEVYAGAVPVENATELRAVVGCNPRGWLVIDGIVRRKLAADELAVLSNLTAHEVEADGMYVFSWRGDGDCPDEADGPSSASLGRLERPGERATASRWSA
jgi:hypothetical protein